MHLFERAAQVYSLLAYAANQHRTVSYQELAAYTGLVQRGLGPTLDIVQEYCSGENLPPLTSLVVSIITGRPERGFTADDDFQRAQARAFAYDWRHREAPQLNRLQERQNAKHIQDLQDLE